jgi:heptaprenyl diphosphate synthase
MQPHSEDQRLIAFFGALCLFLSTIEYVIPKPLPFMRLGLANLPILIALGLFPARRVLLLVALKIVGQAFIYGSLFSYVFLFSAAGSLASGLVMLVVHRLAGRWTSLVGVSVAGALASNLVQVVLAWWFILGEGARLIGPPFLAVGLASSIALGLFAERFAAVSVWLAGLKASRG